MPSTFTLLAAALTISLVAQSPNLPIPPAADATRTPVATPPGGNQPFQAFSSIPPGFMIFGETKLSPGGYAFTGLELFASNGPSPWNFAPSMPTGRFGCQAGTMNGKLYFVGGAITNCGRTGVVEAFNPSTNAWDPTPFAPMPTARDNFGGTVMGGKFYAVAGSLGCSSTTRALEVYDPILNQWATKTSLPFDDWALAAGSVNGILYAVGGYNGAPMNVNAAYDPATNAWSMMAPMPTARYAHAVATANGLLYAIGGNGGSGNKVEAYDPNTNTWSQKSPMPAVVGGMSAVTVNGIIYVVGGSSSGIVAWVFAYDPTNDSWSTMSPLQVARAYLGVGAVDGRIFAAGGDSGGPTFLNTMEELVVGRTLYAHRKL